MNHMPLLVRREFWEHRSFVIAPAIVAAILLIGVTFGHVEFGNNSLDKLASPEFASKQYSVMTLRSANSGTPRGALTLLLVAAGACHRAPPPEPEIRPVRAITVMSGAAGEANAYTAEIRARYESDLSFQVGGKIISRAVDAGARVKRDAVLARLDDHDQQIAVQSARAAVVGADAELSRARTDEARYRDLLERGLTTQATFVAQQTAAKTAKSHLEQASGQLQLSRQQLAYTTLHANADGVITHIYEEVGTVVAPGQKIMELPIGERSALLGNGSVDAAIWLSGARQLAEHWQLDATLGITRPGSVEPLPLAAPGAIPFGSVALSWEGAPAYGLTLQIDAHGSCVEDSDLDFLGSAALLTVGGHFLFASGWRFELAVTEDLRPGASPDIVFYFALRHQR